MKASSRTAAEQYIVVIKYNLTVSFDLGVKRVEDGQGPSAQHSCIGFLQDVHINPRQLQIHQYTAALICPKVGVRVIIEVEQAKKLKRLWKRYRRK